MFLTKVFRCTQECFECGLALTASKKVAVRRDHHFDPPWRGPVYSQQASENRLEVISDLHGPELVGGVLADLVGFTDGSH